MTMLTVANITKAYAGRTLFSGLTLTVNREDRLGLVGPNGAGKSTLFRLILGEEEPDGGEITMHRGVRVGYLPQEASPAAEESVLDLAVDHEAEGAHIAKAKKILEGLAFRQSDFDRPAKELSGGWVMRARLARLLVEEPDVLMLDEPTNHLDLETLLWFQEYLRHYPGALLLISHDREFLNQLATGIVEIRQQRLFRYTGNYDSFLEQREAAEEQQLAAYKNQQKDIARLMLFVNRFRAKNTKATQAQSKLKQIERMEKVDAPGSVGPEVDFVFPQPVKSGHRVLRLESVSHSYGENVVYRGIDFELERGQRVVLVGPNGAGKSTLLKLLAGVLPLQAGERHLGYHVHSGYFSQHRVGSFQAGRTVLAEASDTPARVTEEYIRSVLGCFLFRGDDVFKPVDVLSGGEKSRLALVKLLLDPPNFLLMDEPTTHLDMSSVDALIAALSEFTGTLVFISHDVHFIRSLANRVVHVNAGKLTVFPGEYDYYLDKTGARPNANGTVFALSNAQANPVTPRPANPEASSGPSRKEQKRLEAEQRQAISKQKRQVEEIEEEIAALEQRQAELMKKLADPATYADPAEAARVRDELREMEPKLARLTTQWEIAESQLGSAIPN